MTDTMIGTIPAMPAVPCPTWCVDCTGSCYDAEGNPTINHTSDALTVKVSTEYGDKYAGDIKVYLGGYNGQAPYFSLNRDNELFELTLAEAETLADGLADMIRQARTAEFR